MITCQTFRTTLQPGTTDSELLAHMRACDACVEHAVAVDPDNFFRAIGGEEMVPPGGIDAFTSEVMAQVHLRQTESSFESHRVLSWPRRFAIAATIAASAIGGLLVLRHENAPVQIAAHAAPRVTRTAVLTTKPIIESYQSQNATIVEVPTDGANVVMIFDEKLPADL